MQEKGNDVYILRVPKRVSALMVVLIVVMGSFVAVLGADYIKYIKNLNDALPLILMVGVVVMLISNYFLKYGKFEVRFDFINHKITFQNAGRKTVLSKDDVESWRLYRKTFQTVNYPQRAPETPFIFEAKLKNSEKFIFWLHEEHTNNEVVDLFKKALRSEPTSVELTDQFSSEKDREFAKKVGHGKSSAPNWLVWAGIGGIVLALAALYFAVFLGLITQ